MYYSDNCKHQQNVLNILNHSRCQDFSGMQGSEKGSNKDMGSKDSFEMDSSVVSRN
jgi:hypothetical protein